MNFKYVQSLLENLENPKRENREFAAKAVLKDKNLFKHLVSLTFLVDDKLSIKAAWVLEWICTHHQLEWLAPHLDEFTANINKVKFDSAIRPCAKICEHLANAYYSKKENVFKKELKDNHIDAIVETGFDWLITPQKIAVRAYTMNVLYLFGLEKEWIHPELKHLIETKIIHESKGTKARGKYILDLIEKHQKTTL